MMPPHDGQLIIALDDLANEPMIMIDLDLLSLKSEEIKF